MKKWKKLLAPEMVSFLSQIHEFKGEQTLFIKAKADSLTRLVEFAKIQSTEASNKIAGYRDVEISFSVTNLKYLKHFYEMYCQEGLSFQDTCEVWRTMA